VSIAGNQFIFQSLLKVLQFHLLFLVFSHLCLVSIGHGILCEVDVEMEGVVTAEHLLPASFVEQMREAVPRERYLYPSYLSNFGVLILIAIAVIAQLTHLTKILLLLSIAGNSNKIT